MTDNRMALLALAEKAGETDFLRDLVREVVQELMEAEVEGLCGASRHERSAQRHHSAIGYQSPNQYDRQYWREPSEPKPECVH